MENKIKSTRINIFVTVIRALIVEVNGNGMAVLWLRVRKQSSGTYRDLSMATYCCDVDYVISADKVFCCLVGEAGSVAEFPVAAAIKVRGGQQGVIDLFQIIGEL